MYSTLDNHIALYIIVQNNIKLHSNILQQLLSRVCHSSVEYFTVLYIAVHVYTYVDMDSNIENCEVLYRTVRHPTEKLLQYSKKLLQCRETLQPCRENLLLQ